MKEPNTKYILWDLDGTLLGSHGLSLRVRFISKTLALFRRQSGSWTHAFKGLRDMRKSVETGGHESLNIERAQEAVAKNFGIKVDEARTLINRISDEVFPSLKPVFFPLEDGLKIARWAQGKFPMALTTNPVWPEAIIHMRMQWAGLAPTDFSLVTHAGNMHSCKPTTTYYEEVLNRLGVGAEHCLLIGDSVRKELPATRVGIPVFLLSPKNKLRKIPGAKAAAWTGNYSALHRFLEKNFKTKSALWTDNP